MRATPRVGDLISYTVVAPCKSVDLGVVVDVRVVKTSHSYNKTATYVTILESDGRRQEYNEVMLTYWDM